LEAKHDMDGERHTTILPPYRRAVEVTGGPGWAQAELEDNHHHFRVRVAHDGASILAVSGQAPRTPWSLCPLAIAELKQIEGTPLEADWTALAAPFDQRQQCTHLFDLAMVAGSAAARAIAHRRWDMIVPMRVEDRTVATLVRDDGYRLELEVVGTNIVAPIPFAGVSLKRGFPQWASATLPLEQAEAALLLRRALFVGKGSRVIDHRPTAGSELRNPGGCFVMQPERAHAAKRVVGNSREFPNPARGPLSRAKPR
jgi:hypothetical protein